MLQVHIHEYIHVHLSTPRIYLSNSSIVYFATDNQPSDVHTSVHLYVDLRLIVVVIIIVSIRRPVLRVRHADHADRLLTEAAATH